MEKKVVKTRLEEVENNIRLVFELNPDKYIDMNSEDQSQLRVIFYDIVKMLFEFEISFEHTNKGVSKPIFAEIADEYVKQLETEIRKIQEQIPAL